MDNVYAVVVEGVVVNLIVWDGQTKFDPGAGATLVPFQTDMQIGDAYPAQ